MASKNRLVFQSVESIRTGVVDLVDLANIQPKFRSYLFRQHSREGYRKSVVMALIYLDDRHNKVDRQFGLYLFYECLCDSQGRTMISSFGSEISEAGFQLVNGRVNDDFRELSPRDTRWEECVLFYHNHQRLNQGETFPFGSKGGRTIFRNPLSQWTTTHS